MKSALNRIKNASDYESVLSIVGPVDKVIIPEQIPANMTHTRWRKQKKRGLNHPLEVQGHDGKETFLSHSGNASFPDFGQAMFSLQNGETTLCPDFSQTHH